MSSPRTSPLAQPSASSRITFERIRSKVRFSPAGVVWASAARFTARERRCCTISRSALPRACESFNSSFFSADFRDSTWPSWSAICWSKLSGDQQSSVSGVD
jgi:hypothetical protein